MKVEILTIGDEILSGDILNSNSAYLSSQLWSCGLMVSYHSSVRDDAETIQEALLLASQRSHLVLVTGGLGPTADDFTLEIAAKTFRKKLVLDEAYLAYLKNLLKQWGRSLNENNKKQAFVPQGAKTFQNRVGTAPGVGLIFKKTPFYFFPGVPRELHQLFEDFVLPEILRSAGTFFRSKRFNCFGAAEADLDAALKDLYQDRTTIDHVRIGFRAHFPETMIKLSAWGAHLSDVEKRLKEVEEKIRSRVGRFIYGEGDESLESVVGGLLKKEAKTVGVAESCTGGFLAHCFTNISGSSDTFKCGVVAYSNEAKMKILGVSPDLLKKHGAVSSQCVIEMAQAIRRVARCDYGIAVTGIAGPTGGSEDKPVGTVHIALASSSGTKEKKYLLPMGREIFKVLVAKIALNKLRRALLHNAI